MKLEIFKTEKKVNRKFTIVFQINHYVTSVLLDCRVGQLGQGNQSYEAHLYVSTLGRL